MIIRHKQSLVGTISGLHELQGDIGSREQLAGSVNVSAVFSDHNETYEGPYSVSPAMEAKTLLTKNKLLTDDVVVQPVPIFRVGNVSGGTTVYIANEV